MSARVGSARWLPLVALTGFAAVVGVALVSDPLIAQQAPRGPREKNARSADHAPRDVLYRPVGESTPELRARIRTLVGAVEEQTLWRGLIYRLVLPEGGDLAAALQTLNESGLVRYAEPNWIVHAAGIPNDPQFPNQWALDQASDVDIDAPEMWDLGNGGNEVVVAVIDSGIDSTHEDLVNQLWVNPDEIPSNGIDDEGDGWIDDVHGIDVVNLDGDPTDDFGHGTPVSGTIAAEADNGKGIAGTCWSARIMALKFLDSAGSGTNAGAITCLNYAVAHGVLVSNHSYVGPTFSQALYDAFDLAGDSGHLAVAAAGNSSVNLDQTPAYPVCFALPEILSVAASDEYDDLASFSDFGKSSVDLLVPGNNILSTTLGNGYGYGSGCSYACPHATGVAALLFSSGATSDGQQVKKWLLQSVDPFQKLSVKCATSGRLNGWQALQRASVNTLATSLWSMDGSRTAAKLGEALVSLGDVDGDGRDDVAVGAPGDKAGGFTCGTVAVVSGATGTTIRTIAGPPQNGARFGAALAALGDVNSDGISDFVVGMPDADGAVVNGGGYRIVSGANGATIVESFGGKLNGHEGFALCAMGDLNANGIGDFVIGSTGVSRTTARNGANGGLLWNVTRTSTDEFGAALANVGDRNGDGKNDVLVGAPGVATADVLSGATGGTLMTLSAGVSDRFGATVASLGDVNNDGSGDFAIGNDARARSVRVIAGSTGSLLYRVTAEAGEVGDYAAVVRTTDRDRDHHPDYWVAWRGLDVAELHSATDGALLQVIEGPSGSTFGFSLLGDADVDGDGEWDLVAGAPTEDPPIGNNAGRIHAFKSEEMMLSITPNTPNEGDDVTLLATGGEVDAPIILVATELDGIPIFEILLVDYVGAFGRYALTDTIPPGSSGETFTIQVWSVKYPRHRLVTSNPASVAIQ